MMLRSEEKKIIFIADYLVPTGNKRVINSCDEKTCFVRVHSKPTQLI